MVLTTAIATFAILAFDPAQRRPLRNRVPNQSAPGMARKIAEVKKQLKLSRDPKPSGMSIILSCRKPNADSRGGLVLYNFATFDAMKTPNGQAVTDPTAPSTPSLAIQLASLRVGKPYLATFYFSTGAQATFNLMWASHAGGQFPRMPGSQTLYYAFSPAESSGALTMGWTPCRMTFFKVEIDSFD